MREPPDFKAAAREAHLRLGEPDVVRLLEAGRAWDLAPTLRDGGAVLFPHIGIEMGGHLVAAAVHACLDSGAKRVLALGVLHALTEELEQARVRVAAGGDPEREASWGIQGPGLERGDEWEREFSLDHFQFLWKREIERRGCSEPELILRYPYLAGGRPDRLPGIEELHGLVRDVVVVATGDLFHHGIGYGDPPEHALDPGEGGLELGRREIEKGLALLQNGDYRGYNRHAVEAKSDARDVGQVLRHLLGPLHGRILELSWEDMSRQYKAPAPTWVAGALIAFRPGSEP
jgi:hypothetical protein